MSYSLIHLPSGIKTVRLKHPQRTTPNALRCGLLVADRFDENTWFVWNYKTGIIEAVFSMPPNIHGWSAPEAHAKNYINRASSVDIFALDQIP